MSDYERSTSVDAAPDQAFAWLADPANLPRYLPMMTHAERTEGGLRVTANGPEGKAVVRDVRFEVDERARRFRWHPEGSEYHGTMIVEPDGGGSRVTARIHATPKATKEQVEDALASVLDKIGRALRR